jgi:AGZA family xanthine/uracil permease-like MFS transporter
MEQLDKMFGVTEAGSTVETEIKAGASTFLTMAYILLVNPSMLSVTGIPFEDALFATAVAAFVGCMAMAFWAKLPFAMAPGMGLNAYFAFTVAAPWAMAIPWEVALAAVLVEGVLFMILSLPQIGARTAMINAIPTDLKIATGAGIGMFLAIIGLREMGWIAHDNATLVNLADTASMDPMTSGAFWAMIGLFAIAVMMAREIKGAIIFGILGVSIIGWVLGVSDPYNEGYAVINFCFEGDAGIVCDYTPDFVAGVAGHGVAEAPALDAIFSMPSWPTETFGAAVGALGEIGGEGETPYGEFALVMIAFLFVDIFDTAGTLYSVGRQAGYVDENDELMNSDEAFMSDAAATIVGALLGTSTTTTYIESAAGIEEGGRTGLTAATVGVLMLSGLFFSGLFEAIPQYAMGCALVIVGAMMMRQAADIDWGDKTMALPAFITMVMMPFTYSIADGIAWGIISYCAMMVGTGRFSEINKIVGGIALLMLMFYLGPGDETTFEMLIGGL